MLWIRTCRQEAQCRPWSHPARPTAHYTRHAQHHLKTFASQDSRACLALTAPRTEQQVHGAAELYQFYIYFGLSYESITCFIHFLLLFNRLYFLLQSGHLIIGSMPFSSFICLFYFYFFIELEIYIYCLYSSKSWVFFLSLTAMTTSYYNCRCLYACVC